MTNFRYGLTQIPSLVFFEFRVPEMFPGDLKNDDEILEWITKELTDLDMEEVNLHIINSKYLEAVSSKCQFEHRATHPLILR